jgi:hypothetical protein
MVEYLFNVKVEGRVRAGFRLRGLCGRVARHIARRQILTASFDFDPGFDPFNTHTPRHLRRPVSTELRRTNEMSSVGRHSRVPSFASASASSSGREKWMGADPPYQQPWLNRLVKVFISLHNAFVIPFILGFTSAVYAAMSEVLGRQKCPTSDPSNGAIVVLNSTAGNAALVPFPSWPPTQRPGCSHSEERPFVSAAGWSLWFWPL